MALHNILVRDPVAIAGFAPVKRYTESQFLARQELQTARDCLSGKLQRRVLRCPCEFALCGYTRNTRLWAGLIVHHGVEQVERLVHCQLLDQRLLAAIRIVRCEPRVNTDSHCAHTHARAPMVTDRGAGNALRVSRIKSRNPANAASTLASVS